MIKNSQNDSYARGRTALAEPPARSPRFVEEHLRIPQPPMIEDQVVRAEPEPVRRQAVSLFALLGFTLAAVLLALTLLARVNLTYIANDTASLQARLEELEAERRVLLIRSQTAGDLEWVEAAARSEIGNVRIGPGQKPAPTVDKILVFDNKEAAPGWGEKLGIFVRSFRAYFKGGLSYNY